MSDTFEAVIGLEIHAQLLTATKIFCGCPTAFGAAPNAHSCPVCVGLPGALPVLNRKAVDLAVTAAVALGCDVQERSVFARKNYFYPDLPKGYQISQYEQPLALGGGVTLPASLGNKFVRLTRIHMEEDAGKSLHDGFPDSDRKTYLDYNRSGVPLIEIVSEPDMRSAEEAAVFFETLRQILVWLGVNDGNMDEGSLRCDANVSVRRRGESKLGTKAEVKNVNSFRYLEKAIDYEIGRQVDLIEHGGRVVQETRLFDAAQGKTTSMRSKEEAHDYRYFPDPDLPALVVDAGRREQIVAQLPELPEARRRRFIEQFALPEYDAALLTQTRGIADYFEATAQQSGNAKAASNWVMGEVLRNMKERAIDIGAVPITPAALAGLIAIRRQGHHQLDGRQGRVREDVRQRPGRGRHRRRRRTGADFGFVEPRADRAAGDRRTPGHRRGDPRRQGSQVPVPGRPGDEGNEGQGRSEDRHRSDEGGHRSRRRRKGAKIRLNYRVIETQSVAKTYGRGMYALRDLNLKIDKGEFAFLTGPSGSGKSTLLRLLLLEERPSEGQVIVGGRNLSDLTRDEIQAYRRTVGFVFQDFKLIATKTVFENVSFALRVLGQPVEQQRRRTYQVLKWVGLQHRLNALPEELSGGEQQRVAIARALVNEPHLVLADEPTGNLDPDLSLEIMNLFRDINAGGTTVLVATHDRELIKWVGRRVIQLEYGRHDGTPEDAP